MEPMFGSAARKFRIVMDVVMVSGWGTGAFFDLIPALKGSSYGPFLIALLITVGFSIDLWRVWRLS
jgi:hypothetical protein